MRHRGDPSQPPPAQPHPRGAMEEGLTTSSAPEPHPKPHPKSCEALGRFRAALRQTHRSAPGAGEVGAQHRAGRDGTTERPAGSGAHATSEATQLPAPRKKRAHGEVKFPLATTHLGQSRGKRSHIAQRRCSDCPLLIPSLQPPTLEEQLQMPPTESPDPPSSGLHAVPAQTPRHPAPLGTIKSRRLGEAEAPFEISARPSAATSVWATWSQATWSAANRVYGQRSLWSTWSAVRCGLLPTWSTRPT